MSEGGNDLFLRNIKHYFGNLSLSRKLFLCLFLLVIIPMVVAGLLISYKSSEQIRLQTHETALQVLKQTRLSIETIIKETEYLSLVLLSDEGVQVLSKNNQLDSNQALGQEETRRNLFVSVQSTLESRPFVNSVSLRREENIIFQYGDIVEREDNRFDQTAIQLKGRGFWTSVYTLQNRLKDNDDRNVISYIRVVNDLNRYNQPLSILRVSLNESALSKSYETIHNSDKGGIYILDSEGTVVSSTDKQMVGQNVSQDPLFQQVMSGREGYFYEKINSESISVIYYVLDEIPWRVIQLIPASNIIGQQSMINLIILTFILCLLFGILFSIVQNKTIIIPIKQISREMNKVKKGDFNIRLQLTSMDEIGNLGNIFANMVVQLKDLIEKVYKSDIKEKEAQLKALEAQINPHFLYNTLDCIRWIAIKNNDHQVGEQIEALSDIFKHTLKRGQDTITLKEEVDFLQSYLLIQKARFGDKISIQLSMDEHIGEYQTLKLIIQPLIENALQHGLWDKSGEGQISILIEKMDALIKCTVTDDGVGVEETEINKIMTSHEETTRIYALRNINERIKLKYGNNYGLKMTSRVGYGTRVEVIFPAKK
jgi:two-component system sensor histidine kinase YesM